ncbi:MAG: PEGA domain-containing protein [Methanoregula sp.]|nr:PEGA domain-containing protein [Methanoregula sp.]
MMVCVVTPGTSAARSCIVSVTSIPDEGIVMIDGQLRGTTPLSQSLPCGQYSFKIEKAGYEPYQTQVLLTEEGPFTIVANLEYKSERGSVVVGSDPPGGTLYIDGVLQGTTPVQVDNLLYGRHSVLIKKSGYRDYSDVVSAGPGSVHEYREYLVPEPQTGFFGVSSDPEGARVYLDGTDLGTTPTRLQQVSADNHTMIVQNEGFYNYTTFIEVPGGESLRVHADLVKVPDTGTIIIDSTPQGASISINGTYKGLTPAVFENIPRGAYTLTFAKGNFSDLNTTFILNGGETREILAYLTIGIVNPANIRESIYHLQSNASQPIAGIIDLTPSIERTYTWYNNGHEATIRLRIPQELYDHYKGQPHQPQSISEYQNYALTDEDRSYLHDLIGILKNAQNNRMYSARNDYRNVVSFVQSVTYSYDTNPDNPSDTTFEYAKYPLETLADGEGDCEDTAILTAALLNEMGYDVALVFVPEHAAVAVACDTCNGYYYPLNGKRYYYLETTGAGFSLGSMGTMESKIKNAPAQVIPL